MRECQQTMKTSKRIRKQNREHRRQMFWWHMMEKHPKLYRWCENHLPFDTLPF